LWFSSEDNANEEDDSNYDVPSGNRVRYASDLAEERSSLLNISRKREGEAKKERAFLLGLPLPEILIFLISGRDRCSDFS
jgi:hypothetical protein